MTPHASTSTKRPRLRFVGFLAASLVAAATSGPRAVSPDVVISQVYGGGGNAGATLRNDFVELFNRGPVTVSLTGWSIQYASAAGTGNFGSNPIAALSGNLASSQYYLVQLASGGANGALLPASDATGTVNMSGTGGKVALVNTTAGVACNGGSTPCSAIQLGQIIDLVGWGGANFFEAAAAPATIATTAVIRNANGCAETDNNGADFSAGTPAPRNAASPLNPCAGDAAPNVLSTAPSNGAANVALAANVTVTFNEAVNATTAAFTISCTTSGLHTFLLSGGPTNFMLNPDVDFATNETCTVTVLASQVTDQDADDPPNGMIVDFLTGFATIEVCGDPTTSIHDVQGSGLQSPLSGTAVSIEGVVTADYQGVGQLGGYFVQGEDADADADPGTSEGIFVFNTSVPVNVGDKVRVRGTVSEFLSSGTFLTELTPVTSAQVCSSGNAAPATSTINLPLATLIVPPTDVGTAGRGFAESKAIGPIGCTRYTPNRCSSTPASPLTVSPERNVLPALNPPTGWLVGSMFC